jgi:putative membrane protein
VPFDWGNQLLSKLDFDFILPEGRNNFDRLGHFLVGVFAKIKRPSSLSLFK